MTEEEDRARLFLKYDKERKLREFLIDDDPKAKFIKGPIRRAIICDSKVEYMKDDAYERIKKIRVTKRDRFSSLLA